MKKSDNHSKNWCYKKNMNYLFVTLISPKNSEIFTAKKLVRNIYFSKRHDYITGNTLVLYTAELVLRKLYKWMVLEIGAFSQMISSGGCPTLCLSIFYTTTMFYSFQQPFLETCSCLSSIQCSSRQPSDR